MASEIKPDMRTASERIKKIVESDGGYLRAFMTTLTFGLSGRRARARKPSFSAPGCGGTRASGRRERMKAKRCTRTSSFSFPSMWPPAATAQRWQVPERALDLRRHCVEAPQRRFHRTGLRWKGSGGTEVQLPHSIYGAMGQYRDRLASDIETMFGEPGVEAQKRGISPMEKTEASPGRSATTGRASSNASPNLPTAKNCSERRSARFCSKKLPTAASKTYTESMRSSETSKPRKRN